MESYLVVTENGEKKSALIFLIVCDLNKNALIRLILILCNFYNK